MLERKHILAAAAALVAVGWLLPAAAGELSALARGGRLYDNWYKELGERPPAESHRAYPLGGAAAGDPAQTWRCVACHGWDYRGVDGAHGRGENYTGIKGVAAMAGADPEAVLRVITDDTHGYGEWMDRADLMDIARFVSRGQTPLMARIDPATGAVAADVDGAPAVYHTVCATCHGADGQAIASIPPLGDMAREDPWQTLHSIVNGHPGGVMPALRALDDGLVLGTVAYLQGLPPRQRIAAITRGGRLYDNWARETGRLPPHGQHPAYPKTVDETDHSDTWRCRECHGWDYRGKDGAYAEGRHATGIKGIAGMAGAEPHKVVAVLTDATHRFRGVLSQRDLMDLATFVAEGQTDHLRLIDPKTGRFKGDAAAYEPHFQTMCASCHGPDGRAIRTMPALGRVAKEEPWRSLHSVLNGHPGESMPPLRAFPEAMVGGLLAYAQGLPEKK